jgi:hypothetical protein
LFSIQSYNFVVHFVEKSKVNKIREIRHFSLVISDLLIFFIRFFFISPKSVIFSNYIPENLHIYDFIDLPKDEFAFYKFVSVANSGLYDLLKQK